MLYKHDNLTQCKQIIYLHTDYNKNTFMNDVYCLQGESMDDRC